MCKCVRLTDDGVAGAHGEGDVAEGEGDGRGGVGRRSVAEREGLGPGGEGDGAVANAMMEVCGVYI